MEAIGLLLPNKMFSLESKAKIADLGVKTTQNRGHTIEEIAEMAVNKIVSVGDQAPAPIRAQAHAFKDACKKIIMYYMIRENVFSAIKTLLGIVKPTQH